MRVGTLILVVAPAVLQAQPSPAPPPVAREFRAVWVATVANIDWPSRPGLSAWEQQAELLRILNAAAALNLNAVVLQVRPAGDALYPSRYEPWSEFLTGQQGRPPEPFYDPLAFAVEEAHRRGLELHAWFNPFRARHPSDASEAARTHVSRTHPELVRPYGKYLWLDPGDEAVRRFTTGVILDVVRRYDVDGVHIDDYFYPYRESDSAGRTIDFPDDSTWARYVRAGGTLARDDWRRQNVDRFVRDLHREIKRAKPWVKFGVSPFGIWRPGNPPGTIGLDSYQEIFADSRTWLVNGWADYFVPQLYWRAADSTHAYGTLLDWWATQNVRRRHVWPGLAAYRVRDDSAGGWPAWEIVEQVRVTRDVLSSTGGRQGDAGAVFFSARALVENRDGLADALRSGPFAEPALVPPSPWLDDRAPARPTARLGTDAATGGARVDFAPASGRAVRRWVVRARFPAGWTTAVLPATQRFELLTTSAASDRPDVVVVTAVDRLGNESAARVLRSPSASAASGGARYNSVPRKIRYATVK
jgi:uncharacterized lipoprotein YddW (UPF0748 family)